MKHVGFILAAVLTGAGIDKAETMPLVPVSYDMPNGHSGTFHYWDKEYTGSGSTTNDGAWLSGGVGNLTDGIIASQSYQYVENHQGTGPYVGWAYINPTITFHFAQPVNVDRIVLFLDDDNRYGDVNLPSSVDVRAGDFFQNFLINDPASSVPQEVELTGFLVRTDTIEITMYRKNKWIFMSEIQFFGWPDPPDEPGTEIYITRALGRRPPRSSPVTAKHREGAAEQRRQVVGIKRTHSLRLYPQNRLIVQNLDPIAHQRFNGGVNLLKVIEYAAPVVNEQQFLRAVRPVDQRLNKGDGIMVSRFHEQNIAWGFEQRGKIFNTAGVAGIDHALAFRLD